MKKILSIAVILVASLGVQNLSEVNAHCEIPCGIYDDETRVKLIYEHISTIEKSMKQIQELSKEGDKNYNQLVRWVINKEEHAKKIQDIVSQYFLHQRVKVKDASDEAAYKKYVSQLTSLHEVVVYAMKAKQTTDLTYVEKMRESIHAFEHSYFEDEHKH